MHRHCRLSNAGEQLLDRRGFLSHTVSGLAGIALLDLLGRQGMLRGDESTPIVPQVDAAHPLTPRRAHHIAKAKQVLVIFCSGAISHIDTWDYKPKLVRRDGQPMPGGPTVTFQGANGGLARSPWTFRPRGQSGKWTSDLLPHLGDLVDEMCFLHGMTSRTNTHGPGENFMSTGFTNEGFPSMGAWVTYALGSENQNLPAYVAIPDPRGVPQASVNNWGPGFLPAVFQGTPFNATNPVRNLTPPLRVSPQADAAARNLLHTLNQEHARQFPGDSNLAARIAGYELAARMQLSIPQVNDLSTEPNSILRLYGADQTQNPLKANFARNCILARRLIELGVRFVQLFNGAYAMGEGVGNWDGHRSLRAQYNVHGPILDQPAAALLRDLKQRGLLEETLVVWCTEFGRMPMFQAGASGRDHNPHGFTCWLAGAGVKKGFSYGATDDFGYRAIEPVTDVHDLHATILHLLGLNHRRLTYYHNGAQRRLTDVHGNVIDAILT